MDGEGETPVNGGAPPSPPAWAQFPPSTWVGVAVVGVILFVLGIWLPAWRGVPGGVGLNYVAAAAGAVMLVAGLTLAYWVRELHPPTPVEEIPGVDVFRPATVGRPTPPEPDDEPR